MGGTESGPTRGGPSFPAAGARLTWCAVSNGKQAPVSGTWLQKLRGYVFHFVAFSNLFSCPSRPLQPRVGGSGPAPRVISAATPASAWQSLLALLLLVCFYANPCERLRGRFLKRICTDGACASGITDRSVGFQKAVAGLGALCPDACRQQAGPPTRRPAGASGSSPAHSSQLLHAGPGHTACDFDGCCPLSSCTWSRQGWVPVHDASGP